VKFSNVHHVGFFPCFITPDQHDLELKIVKTEAFVGVFYFSDETYIRTFTTRPKAPRPMSPSSVNSAEYRMGEAEPEADEKKARNDVMH